MSTRIPRPLLAIAACLALFALAPAAVGETATIWEAPSEGAAEMFRQGDRVFAVGAASGGAGAVGEPGDGEQLRPRPGGETYHDSRCAMQSGGCSGVCVSHLNYYCSTDSCSSFDFC